VIRKLSILGDLVKFRLTTAVTLSALTGYSIYGFRDDKSLILLFIGVFLQASGSAVLNQYTERESDALMERTMNRPIPGSRIAREKALKISIALLIAGSVSLLLTGLIPALLGIITIILYNFVYTRLKRISFLAVIPGAMVGAIPPLIGFTAAGGNAPSLSILLFSGFMFFWQLPHFWLIIIRYKNDYSAAGFKTFPGDMNISGARILIFVWVTISTVILSVFAVSGILFSPPLNYVVIPLNIVFIVLFHSLLFSDADTRSARGAFILINSFSLMMMLLFVINSLIK
jgi:heme o synthase